MAENVKTGFFGEKVELGNVYVQRKTYLDPVDGKIKLTMGFYTLLNNRRYDLLPASYNKQVLRYIADERLPELTFDEKYLLGLE